MRTAQDLGGNRSELDLQISLIYGSLGATYQALNNVPKLQESYSESLNLLKSLAASQPDNTEYVRYLSWAHQNLGEFFLSLKNQVLTLEQYQACLAVRKKLANDDPSDWIYQYDLAWAHHLLGNYYLVFELANVKEASEHFEAAYQIRKRLTQADPSNKRWRKDFALSLETLGDIANRRNNNGDTERNYRESRAILQELVDNDPTNSGWISLLSDVTKKISRIEAVEVPVEAPSKPPE
jgi:tetratricopeptide (TPR) repeat protein